MTVLSQAAADYLARVAKEIVSAKIILVPPAGGTQAWEAQDHRRRNKFHLHMRRGRRVAMKVTAQERYWSNEILLRLDVNGPAHTNPDGTIVPTPHLHIYREGYDDKWAFPVPPDLDISSGQPDQRSRSNTPCSRRVDAVTVAEELVASYLDWLKQSISVQNIGDWIQISTPFLDRHNDHLQIYVRAEDGHLVLSDDGYILDDLEACGCDIGSPRRRELLQTILRGYGVELHNRELTVRATRETFAQRKHALLQAMLGVNDLFLTSRATVRGLFLEEIEQFLISHEIRFVHAIQIAGRSGLSHTFDYAIPAWQRTPERLLKAVNSPTKDKIQSLLFAWTDIRDVRKGSKFFVVVNDDERKMPSRLKDACESEGVGVIPWSQRNDFAAILSA